MTPLRGRRAGGRAPGVLAVPGLAAHDRAGRRLGHPLRARHRASSSPPSSDRPAQPGLPRLRRRSRRTGRRPGRRLRDPGVDLTKDEALRACRPATRPARPGRRAARRRPDHRRRRHAGHDVRRRWSTADPRHAARRRSPITYVRDGDAHHRDRRPGRRPSARRSTTPTAPGRCRRSSAIGARSASRRTILHYVRPGRRRRRPRSTSSARPSSGTFTALEQVPGEDPQAGRRASAAASATRRRRSAWSAPAGSAARPSQTALPIVFLVLLGGLNVFIGVFNLLPLLPLDGGHIAIAWFERVRSWLSARLRPARPGPGRLQQADAADLRGDPDRSARSRC